MTIKRAYERNIWHIRASPTIDNMLSMIQSLTSLLSCVWVCRNTNVNSTMIIKKIGNRLRSEDNMENGS